MLECQHVWQAITIKDEVKKQCQKCGLVEPLKAEDFDIEEDFYTDD